MEPQEIRSALKLRKCSIEAIGRGANVSGPTVHRAINGQARCARAEQAVAEALGLRREEVFGLNRSEVRRLAKRGKG